MKLQTLAVLAVLTSIPVFAQSLPDEINSAPYETRLNAIRAQITQQKDLIKNLKADISEARRFISESEAFISNKQREIRTWDLAISENRSIIPRLQDQIRTEKSKISTYEYDRGIFEAKLQRLSSEEHNLLSTIRPLENSLNIRRDQLRRMDQEIDQLKREEAGAQQRIAELSRQLSGYDAQINQERSSQESIRQELREFDVKIAQIQSRVQNEESAKTAKESELRLEEGKLSALGDRVREYESELSRLRSSGAAADLIQAAERKVNASSAKRDEVSRGIPVIRNEVVKINTRIHELNYEIEIERRNQTTVPARIAQSESRIGELQRSIQGTKQQISPLNLTLISSQRRIQERSTEIISAEREVNSAENAIRRYQDNLVAVRRDLEEYTAALISRRDLIARANQEIVELSAEERERTQAIPQFEAAIKKGNTEISSSQSSIRSSQSELSQFTSNLSSAESSLAQMNANESSTENAYVSRSQLYQQYLEESQKLGESQVSDADKLGHQTGLLLSKTKSISIGQASGKELGSAEGKFWALVRAEIQGYPKGYEAGIISNEDIQRGVKEGEAKGAAASELYAQTTLKPTFFDQFYALELKKPVPASVPKTKSMKIFNEMFEVQSITAGIDPVSYEELSKSEGIVSTLNSSISSASRLAQLAAANYSHLNSAYIVFETPATIPYGKVQCATVYKGVQAYKNACDVSYKELFKEIYVEAASVTFSANYPDLYVTEAKKTRPDAQSSAFEAQFQPSYKVAQNDGLVQGKIDIYNKTYTETYQATYDATLPAATSKATEEARSEVSTWIKANASLTVEGSSISKQVLRGGDEAKLLVDLKNLSPEALKSNVLLKVTSNQNAQLAKTEYVVTQVPGSKITRYEEITFKIPANVRSGETVAFKVEAVVPGHKYSQLRLETVYANKILAANPKVEVKADYLTNPDIRNIFRTKVHGLTYTLKPVVEDIADGYEVLMEVVEGKDLIYLEASTQKTGALKANQVKNLEYTYTFPKHAKNQKVSLKITVKYLGEVIQVTPIELNPR